VFGKGSSKNGKYGEMRNLMNAKRAGRAMRTTPAAAVQMATVQRAETALAMKNAGYVDVTGTSYSFVTGTAVKQIGVVGIGSAITQRIGGKIKWKSIQVRGVIQPEGSSAAPTLSSLIFIYDRYPQGDVPAATAILASASSLSLLQDSNRSRFVIVRRLDYVTGPATGAAAAEPAVADSIHFVDEYIKLRGLQATYIGSDTGSGSGGMGDIRTGALYVLAIGNTDGATVPPHAVGTLNIRVRFADVQG